MPDITLCAGSGCALRDGCYRFTAKPDVYQSYFVAPPYNPDARGEEQYCEYFWYTKGFVPRRKKVDKELETPQEEKRKRLAKELSCSICPPHKGENSGRKPKRGAQKPKGKK